MLKNLPKGMSILFVVMLFFSLCTSAKAIGKEKEKINLLSDTEKIIIDSTLFLLEDKQKKWTIEEVVSGQIIKSLPVMVKVFRILAIQVQRTGPISKLIINLSKKTGF